MFELDFLPVERLLERFHPDLDFGPTDPEDWDEDHDEWGWDEDSCVFDDEPWDEWDEYLEYDIYPYSDLEKAA